MRGFKEIISYGHIENKLMYPHCNPGMELVLVEQGRLEWAVGQVPEILVPWTVFFTLPWQTHGSLQLREPRNRIYFCLFSLPGALREPHRHIHFPGCLGFSADETEMLSRIFMSAPHHAWPASGLLKQLFPELIRRLGGSSALDCSASIAILRAVLIELADIIANEVSAPRFNAPTVNRVRLFLQGLGQQLDQGWTLEEMAVACGIKRTQFAKVVRQLTGYAPLQYLNRIRFEKSCELLGGTSMSITDIAYECGYASSQYFAESFRKHAQMTPSEFRRKLPEINAAMEANWSHPEYRSISDEKNRASIFSH